MMKYLIRFMSTGLTIVLDSKIKIEVNREQEN